MSKKKARSSGGPRARVTGRLNRYCRDDAKQSSRFDGLHRLTAVDCTFESLKASRQTCGESTRRLPAPGLGTGSELPPSKEKTAERQRDT